MANLEKMLSIYIRDKGLMSLMRKDPLEIEARKTINSDGQAKDMTDR